MAKKIRRMRTFARTASKSMEKNLVQNAKELKKDPYLILPECADNYSKKYIGKLKKGLDKVYKFKEDTKKLEKFANKKDLAGSLAATLLVAHSEKAPYLAVAKFATGDVTYAQRGKADKQKLIATQHFDDPVLRLLGIKDIALKKKLHVYSWDGGFVSTGLEANPPKEFVDFIVKKVNLSNKSNIAVCSHLNPKDVKEKKPSKKYYLRIHWKSADIVFSICVDCAKSSKNTIYDMTKYMIIPDVSDDFEIQVIGQEVKKDSTDAETLYLDDYLSGKLKDADFIVKNKKHRIESIKDAGEKLFILDGNSYGSDASGFIDALDPNEFERKGLELVLNQIDKPVVLKNVTPNKVLDIYWKDYGQEAINSLINDEELAKKFFLLDDTPSDILEAVINYSKRQKILAKLPRYKSLPELAAFADNIARTYKTFGEKKALTEIKKRPDTTKGKSLAYAFLLAFGKGSDKKWKYSQVEVEYGEFLKDFARKLLDSTPETYHKALQELLTNSGSSENIGDKQL